MSEGKKSLLKVSCKSLSSLISKKVYECVLSNSKHHQVRQRSWRIEFFTSFLMSFKNFPKGCIQQAYILYDDIQ